ncbi:MAG: Pyrimidine-specific ribonucleoside hydrolase RihA [Phycisphaerae bacterium]|nr:Pyrimidine-specific ribonucleoside hydrolase RihA [Phycisphaerae bacterium]
MPRFNWLLAVVLLMSAGGGAALAHEGAEGPARPAVVIDTDLGLDDAATLALALQSPDMELAGVVAADGACSAEQAARLLARLLDRFNRGDVPLYAAAMGDRAAAPKFRPFVERALAAALDASGPTSRPDDVRARPIRPDSYLDPDGKSVVLALGPLTNLAAALKAQPAMAARIERIVIPGPPDPVRNWNIARDAAAWAVVRESKAPIVFIEPNSQAVKPQAWAAGEWTLGPLTSAGECFLRDLLGEAEVRKHYVTGLAQFYDELAWLYLVAPGRFDVQTRDGVQVATPRADADIAALFVHELCEGRQHRDPVLLVDPVLPAASLQPDVRERMARIIAANGRAEWFAQLVMNELHEHLGAYSIIGVKMGLRAAELLNAPQHGMKVVTHVPPGPPVSCLNDGVIVATGSTPGRALFAQGTPAAGRVSVTFSYNGRSVTLTLKDEYRRRIAGRIAELLKEHTLEDAAYWAGVRSMGLEIWETWHRRDLFTATPGEGR